MTDLLREIDEELERERMFALWMKYRKAVLGAAALLVLGTASYSAWRDHNQAQRVQRSLALYQAMADGSAQQQLAAVQGFLRAEPGASQGILAQLAEAQVQIRTGQTAQAVTALETAARDAGAPSALRQYAELMALQLQVDTGDPATLRGRLDPLAAASSPWRFTARALQALLWARSGDTARAQTILVALAKDQEAPPDLRGYARDMASWYATKG